MFLVVFTKQAEVDKKLLKQAGLEQKAKDILNILRYDPYKTPPRYEKLVGNLRGNISRRINIQHRIVYEVVDNIEMLKDVDGNNYDGIVKVKRMWSHYER